MNPKKAPYATTEVEMDKSRAQIDKLLRDAGSSGVQWTTLWEKERVELAFEMVHAKGKTVVRIIAPTFKTPHKSYDAKLGRSVTVEAPNWKQSFRLLYYYLKSKLEAVQWGLRAFEEEFLADTVVTGPHGEQMRVAEVVAVTAGKLDVRALGPGASRAGPVDAEVVSSGHG